MCQALGQLGWYCPWWLMWKIFGLCITFFVKGNTKFLLLLFFSFTFFARTASSRLPHSRVFLLLQYPWFSGSPWSPVRSSTGVSGLLLHLPDGIFHSLPSSHQYICFQPSWTLPQGVHRCQHAQSVRSTVALELKGRRSAQGGGSGAAATARCALILPPFIRAQRPVTTSVTSNRRRRQVPGWQTRVAHVVSPSCGAQHHGASWPWQRGAKMARKGRYFNCSGYKPNTSCSLGLPTLPVRSLSNICLTSALAPCGAPGCALSVASEHGPLDLCILWNLIDFPDGADFSMTPGNET